MTKRSWNKPKKSSNVSLHNFEQIESHNVPLLWSDGCMTDRQKTNMKPIITPCHYHVAGYKNTDPKKNSDQGVCIFANIVS